MRNEIIESARTVEEALNSACKKLGYDRDDVEWEIIDLPKKSFLGLKTYPAKVKVWIESEDKEEVSLPPPPTRQQPVYEKKMPAQEARAKAAPARSYPQRDMTREIKAVEMTDEVRKKAEVAKEYLAGICKEMGLEADFSERLEDGGLCIDVKGDGLGAMIGRRGETLDALQYLTGLVGNRLEGEYLRITLDCGDYRTKRKETLEALAKKLSSQVVKTNTSKMLEPMNPFERRIIHAAVSEIEGVSSSSVGEEPNRRVIITSPNARPRNPRVSSRGDNRPYPAGGNAGGGERDNNRRRRSAPIRREPRQSTLGGTINTLPQESGQNTTSGQPVARNQSFPPRQEAAPARNPSPNQSKKMSEAIEDKPLYAKLDLE